MIDKNNIDDFLKNSGANDATKQQINSFIQGLGENELKKLNTILGDKKNAQQILNSPQAQELLKKFGNGK